MAVVLSKARRTGGGWTELVEGSNRSAARRVEAERVEREREEGVFKGAERSGKGARIDCRWDVASKYKISAASRVGPRLRGPSLSSVGTQEVVSP